MFGPGGNQGDDVPAAYLNYILFDQQFNTLDMGWQPVTGSSYFNKAKLEFDPVIIREAGYIFVYLSYENESDNYVYFDDMKVTHTKNNVIQYNEYYPFGLQTGNSWTRENSSNNFLYNAANELNRNNGWYEMFYRGYDPELGRMLQVDPYASSFASHSPFNYSLNNPITNNDPSGGYAWLSYIPTGRDRYDQIHDGYNALFGMVNFDVGGGYFPGSGDHWTDAYNTGYNSYSSSYIDWAIYSGNFDILSEGHYANDGRGSFSFSPISNAYWVDFDNIIITKDRNGNAIIHGKRSKLIIETNSGIIDYLSNHWVAQSGGNDPNAFYRSMADLIRNTPFFGINSPNPFYGAEAMYMDSGGSLVGAEKDGGVFFILAGKEKGTFKTFSELAGGISTEAGVGFEVGRVDISGNPNDFTSDYLYGLRDKVWVSVSPFGEVISVGGAYAWSSINGRTVSTSSVQLGIGVSPFPFLSGGYNHGRIK